MTTIIIMLWIAIVLANILLFAVLYFLPAIIVDALLAVYAPNRVPWRSRWRVRAAMAVAIMVFVPLLLNVIRQHERVRLVRDDTAWEGSLSDLGTVALLSDEFEDKHWPMRGECPPRRCKALLYQHVARSVLVGSPPPVGATLQPALPLTRYRLDHHAWCPPLQRMDDHQGGRNLAELMHLAAGDCLIAEPATLANADVVVVDQPFNSQLRPNYHTVHEAIIGRRLSLYRRDGSGWQELFRKTAVGGSDWLVPMLIGPLNRNLFGAMMFGGGIVGFMTSQDIEAPDIDLAAWLKRWHLSASDDLLPAEADMAGVARKVLADETLPPASAAMQYLASYVWFGGWGGRDRELQAAIIRDRRVADFPYVRWRDVTPPQLAQPIVDRIASTALSGDIDQGQLRANREVVRRLAEIFSLLPACAAAPMQTALHAIARDAARRPYASAMFARLADAGPPAVEDLEFLVTASLAASRDAKFKWEWVKTDGQTLIAALKGLAKLGPRAVAAAPTVVAALKGDLAAYANVSGQDLQAAGIETLISMGEIAAVRSLYAQSKDVKKVEGIAKRFKPSTDEGCAP
jgi:hypothetical protein